ncbi:hypothetical protein C6501_03655 [Candidatus Poribacteria bacterium]|nr:MAG: hypothetical protein C6501_03655 [Candidatus Poribacteria bacterium]
MFIGASNNQDVNLQVSNEVMKTEKYSVDESIAAQYTLNGRNGSLTALMNFDVHVIPLLIIYLSYRTYAFPLDKGGRGVKLSNISVFLVFLTP